MAEPHYTAAVESHNASLREELERVRAINHEMYEALEITLNALAGCGHVYGQSPVFDAVIEALCKARGDDDCINLCQDSGRSMDCKGTRLCQNCEGTGRISMLEAGIPSAPCPACKGTGACPYHEEADNG